MLRIFLAPIFALVVAVPMPAIALDLNDISRGLNAVSDLERALRRHQETPPERSRQVPPSARIVQRPSVRQDVREVQSLLARLGYDPGPADGLMGRRTRNAIIAFERDSGLAVRGEVSSNLLDLLRNVASGHTGSRTVANEHRPSFDCEKASTRVEHTICGNADLAELDRAVARHYAAALDGLDAGGRAQLQAEQRAWIAQRDRCGGDVMCLVYALGKRSQALVMIGQNQSGDAAAQKAIVQQGALDAPANSGGAIDEQIIILSAGSGGSLARELFGKESVQRQRDYLVSMVAAATIGTEHEQIFVNHQSLSPAEVRAAAAEAGLADTSKLEAYISKGMISKVQDVENGYLTVDYNQFEVARFKSALREKALAAIARDRRSSPQRLMLVCGLRAGEYDFEKQHFPFGEKELDTCFAGEQSPAREFSGYRARIPVHTTLRPEGFSVDPAAAEALINRLGRARFALAIPAVVESRISSDRNGRPEFVFDARPAGPLELRSGQNLAEVIYRYPDAALRDITDTPEARRLSDFNRPWWLDTQEEVALITGRADTVRIEALDAGSLFGAETGLTFSFRVKYGGALAEGNRNLAAFAKPQSDRALEEVAQALQLPLENLLVTPLPVVGHNNQLGAAILVFPQDSAGYVVSEELPAHEEQDGGWPFAAVEMAVTAEKLLTLHGGQQRLLLAGHPERLVVRRTSRNRRWQDAPEIGAATFPRAAPREFEEVSLAWKSDLLSVGAKLADWDTEELFREQLESSPYARNDTFAKREAASQLAAAALARSGEENVHWLKAYIRFEPYDFERKGWLVRPGIEFSARAHEADSALNVSLVSGDTAQGVISDQGMFIAMPPEKAQAFQQSSKSFPVFDGLLALRITDVDLSSARTFSMGMTLRYQPVEMLLFDAGEAQTIINPRSVRLRHTFEVPSVVDETPDAMADSAIVAELMGEFAVLGVSLGAGFEASVDEIAEQIGAERRLFARTAARQDALQNQQPINDWDSYHNGILLESAEQQEMVALYHEPPALSDTVTAIVRTRLFGPGKGPAWGQLREQLVQTYSQINAEMLQELERTGAVSIWAEPAVVPGARVRPVDSAAAACKRSLNAIARSSSTQFLSSIKAREAGNMRPADARATWVDENGQPTIPAFASTYSLPQLFGGRQDCPDFEVMVLAIKIGDDGKVVHFRQAVSVPARMAVVEEERKEAAMSDAGSSDFDL
ncbi:peptidoglycan-binding protein [Nitratireductor sp. OM-1]|uniref:peptidoglycan-binding protein n=1 Tax=Nitratireductor sp. OM-1 TaxID=1756988 RepID=UPI000DDC42B7|nr:peptidoglycan-binding protein [Nitratireductor sp. OM-1]